MLWKSILGTGLRVVSALTNLLFGIACSRLFGAADYGTFVFLQSIATIVTTVVTVGLPTLLLRELAANDGVFEKDQPRTLAMLIIAHVVICAALLGAFVAYVYLIGAPGLDMASTALLAALIMTNIVMAYATAARIGRSRVLQSSLLTDLVRPAFALAALLMIYALAIDVANAGLIAQVAAGGVLTLTTAIPLLGEFFAARRSWRSEEFRALTSQFLLQGAQIAVTAALITLSIQVDVLVISAFAPPDEVAHYFAAARLALLVTFFFGVETAYAEPRVVSLLHNNERGPLQKMIWLTATTGFGVSIAAGIAILIAGRFYLGLYGPEFLTAFPALATLVVGQVIWTSYGPAQMGLRAARLDMQVLVLTGLALGLNLVVSVALVPLLGIVGAAIGTALQFILLGLFLARSMRRQTSVQTTVWSLAAWNLALRKAWGALAPRMASARKLLRPRPGRTG